MSRYLVAALLTLLVGCAEMVTIKEKPASQDPVDAEKLISSEDKLAISRAELDGTEIYKQDIAAWVATDFLVEQGVIGSDDRVRGWVTEHAHGDLSYESMVVTFVGEVEGELKRLYQVEAEDWEVFADTYRATSDGADLTDHQLSMFNARQTALASGFTPCSDRYNTAVIPSRDHSTSTQTVYLLAATVTYGEVMVGGNYRVTVDNSGKNLLESFALSKSCLILQKTDDAAALMSTHIVEPTPNAVHVFLSMLHKVTFYIRTQQNGITWKVEGNKISVVER